MLMEFLKFGKEEGIRVSKFNSDFVMSHIIQTNQPANINYMHLEEQGMIGYHQAKTPQLLLVLHGKGYVRGEAAGYVKVQSGDAVFWEKDEWHETKTEEGLTAIVIESVGLNPSKVMSLKVE